MAKAMKQSVEPRDPDEAARDDAAPHEELVQQGNTWVLRERKSGSGQVATSLVPALDKAIRALAHINRSASREATLAAISEAAGITKSHCHAILKTLVHHDWLSYDETARTYRLHAGILRDLSSLLHERSEVSFVRPVLERMSQATGVPCILSEPLPDGSFIVVDKVSAPRQMEISYPVGHRFPRDASAQMRANLAWRSPEDIDEWFRRWRPQRYSSRTVVDPAQARQDIAETRRRGYARSVGEFTDGLMALALPIFDRSGRILFIFDCMSTIPAMLQQEKRVVAEMIRAAAEVHAMFGSQVPGDYPRPAAGGP